MHRNSRQSPSISLYDYKNVIPKKKLVSSSSRNHSKRFQTSQSKENVNLQTSGSLSLAKNRKFKRSPNTSNTLTAKQLSMNQNFFFSKSKKLQTIDCKNSPKAKFPNKTMTIQAVRNSPPSRINSIFYT